ncbi:MAG: SIS domain-containing protein [Candidatus Hodarchaeota archaeon]
MIDYMLQEIREQPQVLRNIIKTMKDKIYEQVSEFREKFQIKRILLTGCGDSLCASLTTEHAFTTHGIPSYALPPMEFSRYKYKYPHYLDPHTLLIPISVSGRTPRVIEAIHAARSRNSPILAITNNPESPVAQLSNAFLYTKSASLELIQSSSYEGEVSSKYIGYEHDVPQTKSYTAVQLTLLLMALSFNLDPDYSLIESIPDSVRQIIENSLIKELGIAHAQAPRYLYCASGPNFGNALFGEFKMYEFNLPGFGKDIEEYCHTAYFVTESDTPVIFIAPPGESLDRTTEIVPVLKRIINTDTIILSETQPNFEYGHWIEIPYSGPEEFSTIPYGVVVPLFAYWSAKTRGRNVNTFRGGVEQEKYVSGSYHTIRQSKVKEHFEK